MRGKELQFVMEPKCVCVYAASADALEPVYTEAARQLGCCIAQHGYSLCYGAGALGLMGELARAVHETEKAKVIGVIPEALNEPHIAYNLCDELHVTETMRQRKQMMEDMSCAFIALPGGFGTLEELLEIITLKQLRYHSKPVVILNVNGFYDEMIAFFNKCIQTGMAAAWAGSLYWVAQTPEQALSYIEEYTVPALPDKVQKA